MCRSRIRRLLKSASCNNKIIQWYRQCSLHDSSKLIFDFNHVRDYADEHRTMRVGPWFHSVDDGIRSVALRVSTNRRLQLIKCQKTI